MIQYTLNCENSHKFEAWFKSGAAFDEQLRNGDVSCPICASGQVEKALMAPAVTTRSNRKVSLSSGHPEQLELQRKLKELRSKVEAEADYVGDKFATEARKIHDEESDPRAIYGEATADEVSGLLEDGIDFMPLPNLPDEHN